MVLRERGVDDPVGAISVHGVCGTWGVLAVGIFANGEYGAGWNGTGADSKFGVYGHPLRADGGVSSSPRLMGCSTIAIVMGGIAYLFFYIQNKLMKGGIRPTARSRSRAWTFPRWECSRTPSFYGSNPHVEMPDHDGLIELPEPVPVGQEKSR